jgi:tetratricopeptide (TPR) repeat protein
MGLGRAGGIVLSVAIFTVLGRVAASPPSVEAASVALRGGNASNAVVLATQALSDPGLSGSDRARVLVDRGLAHEMLGERDGALVDFSEAINAHALSNGEQARAFYDRGVALDELSHTEEAVGDYSAALNLDPRLSAALNNRGNAYRRLERLAEARADYQASLAVGNPHVEYPDYGLGQIAEAEGHPDTALGYYRAALTANPEFSLAMERLTALGNTGAAPDLVSFSPASEAAPVAPDAGEIHLRPPPDPAVVHLHPSAPRSPPTVAPSDPSGLALKPAFSEGAGSAAGQMIQLGAWRKQGDTAIAWRHAAAVAGSLLAGLAPQVMPADLAGRGRFYRLQAGPVDQGTGQGLCRALRAKGLECIVIRR